MAKTREFTEEKKQERCLFLDDMPAELRVMVYETLVIGSEPIIAASHGKSDETRVPALSVLCVNRQIHDEAAAVFYARNTICVRPCNKDGDIQIPAPRYHHLVRHLKIEGLYCPDSPGQEWARKLGGLGDEAAVNQAAEKYISTLANFLPRLTHLHTLHITITPPDDISSKSVLAALLHLQASLPTMLANLPSTFLVLLSFEFQDCYCRMRVSPEFLSKDCLLVAACQVLFWKSHLRVEKMVREARGGVLKGRDAKGRTDLGSLVEKGVGRVVEVAGKVEGLLGQLVAV